MSELAWYFSNKKPNNKPLTLAEIPQNPEDAINSEGVNLRLPTRNDEAGDAGDPRLHHIDQLLAKDNLDPEKRDQLEKRKAALIGEVSDPRQTGDRNITSPIQISETAQASPTENNNMNPEELAALKQRIENSHRTMPSLNFSENQSNPNGETGNVISTSQGEKPNPFHQPIPTPERDNYVKLKENPGGIHDWLDKKYQEEGDGGYRKYLKEIQPNRENQNFDNQEMGTKGENPSNQTEETKAKLKGDYGQPRIRETNNPGDFTPELKNSNRSDSYPHIGNI